MCYRFFASAFLFAFPLGAIAAPLPKDPATGMPHLVWQIKSINGLIEDYRSLQGKLPGIEVFPDQKQGEEYVFASLDEWGKAIDLAKPLGGYLTVSSDLERSRPVIVMPVKEEKAFIALIKQICGDLAEDDDKTGFYRGSFQFFFARTNLAFRILKLKPQEGPQFLVEVNHAKLTSLVMMIDAESKGRTWAKLFPKEERTRLLHGKVEGGDVLRVRYTTDIIPLLKVIAGLRE